MRVGYLCLFVAVRTLVEDLSDNFHICASDKRNLQPTIRLARDARIRGIQMCHRMLFGLVQSY